MRILNAYTNCSLGGMTSVYRGRMKSHPEQQFDYIFENDMGGRGAFESFSNSVVRIVSKARFASYLNYLVNRFEYREMRVTSRPDLLDKIQVPNRTAIVYEFHSPHPEIIKRELSTLDVNKVDEVWAPSTWAANLIESLAVRRQHITVKVVPNLVDTERFNTIGPSMPLDVGEKTPISWIGRLENTQKNYLDFLRTLSVLPDSYVGITVFSLENSPDRLEEFLGQAALLGVVDRLRIYSNLPQDKVGDLHRGVRDQGGLFFSTSLSESFGYAVYEAASCGCPVVSYDVGPLRSHPISGVRFVPVGDIRAAAAKIAEISRDRKARS